MPKPSRALLAAVDELNQSLALLRFSPPVSHVYNPFVYAREAYADYVRRYAEPQKEVLFLGMNPGPFGMAQTGVPFGEVAIVRDWLGVRGSIGKPTSEHPKRVISGFECTRSEVSGARLWGLWRELFAAPERFFAWGFVANYCPLVFMEESGKNLTPDKLPRSERVPLLHACDVHLRALVRALSPRVIVGVGAFARARAEEALTNMPNGERPRVASIPHPSPASPAANRNWGASAQRALAEQGIVLPIGGRADA